MAKSDEILHKLGKIDGNIESMKTDIHDIKLNDKDKWKAIGKNTVAIAGIKGMAIGISSAITLGINTVWMFFKIKGGQS